MKRIVVTAALVGTLSAIAGPASAAAPVVSREHFDFPVEIDACGIGTLNLSIDARNMVSITDSRAHLTTLDNGSGWDAATGLEYHFVNGFSQEMTFPTRGPAVNTASTRFVISSATNGGVVAHAFVHTTVHADGTTTSDVSFQSVTCI
jgi:hypothetical protein